MSCILSIDFSLILDLPNYFISKHENYKKKFNLVYLTSSSVHAAPDVPGMYTVSISGPGFVASPFKITSSKMISSTERIEG